MADDPHGAFVKDVDLRLEGAAEGPLAGLTAAVKDIYDIEGHVTGAGNPDWRRTHEAATATASSVTAIVEAGATVIGKTLTDEIAYSLIGANAHYGTPVNPRAPDRVPGGSSSGSAVAVAAELVDFALGSDTGGSVRVPASFCGLYGIRTSHGRVPIDGLMPLAPSFDTIGWFARTPEILAGVGEVLLGERDFPGVPDRLLIDRAVFELCAPAARTSLLAAVDKIEAAFGPAAAVSLAPDLADYADCFRYLQAHEVWQVHGPWVEAVDPTFGPGIKERFEFARGVTENDVDPLRPKRARLNRMAEAMLASGGVLVWPSAPDAAPLRAADAAALEDYRMRTLQLTCLAGLARLPQVSLPLAEVDGAPLGLSIIAGWAADWLLIGFAKEVAGALK